MKPLAKQKNARSRKNHDHRVEEVLGVKRGEPVSPWRIFRIMAEFVNGFEFLQNYKKAVTIFGSARFPSQSSHYRAAESLAYRLSKDGYAIITGGGPGIMEAANKGAFRAGGKSVGINIRLPLEQRINKYVQEFESFRYFFTRKVMLVSASKLYIFFPGGYGTMDELFELLTLIQTRKVTPVPIILVGKKYWSPLLHWIDETFYRDLRTIANEDKAIYRLVDTVDQAYRLSKSLLRQKKYEPHSNHWKKRVYLS